MKPAIKSKREIKLLAEGGKILAEALNAAVEKAKTALTEKVSTFDLNKIAEKVIRDHKAEPSFLHYASGGDEPYPASLCVSLNNEIVHGLPRKDRFIKEGDLVKLDLGVKYKNLYTDAAVTVQIGKVSEVANKITETTKKSLEMGLQQIYPGSFLGNYGNAVEKYVRLKGFYGVKDLVSHGVGYAVHEFPQIPNYGHPGEGIRIEEGMVFALEPMVNERSEEVILAMDGFTFKTRDGGISAHFEHTIAVTADGYKILTKGIRE